MRAFLTATAMGFASILFTFDATIPVLHLPDYHNEQTRSDFLQKMEKAAVEVGFFALTGTGVDVETLNQAYDETKKYFALDREEKMALLTKDGQRGYVPGESAKGEKRIDYKEFFHVGRELSDPDLKRLGYGKNVWPTNPEGFRPAMQRLYEALDVCKEAMGEAFAAVLNQDPQFINQMIHEGNSLLRAIHYPANPPAQAIWAGAHTDINLFTILPRSTARGLQLCNQQGEWLDVIVPDGAFVINCGDMLENLTNGYFRSALHRVVDPGLGEERFSMTFFVHPCSTDRLDPLPQYIEKTGGTRLYANVSALELLAERLIDLGLASRQLMEFFVQSGAIEKLKEVGRYSPKAEEALDKAGF